MDDLIKTIETEKTTLVLAIRLIKEVSQLENDLPANLFKVKVKLQKIDELLNIDDGQGWREAVRNWSLGYKTKLSESEQSVRDSVANELDRLFRDRGLALSGHYPKLKAGILTIEVDFERHAASIWYGPQQELLTRCALSVEQIMNSVDEVQKKLGSKITPSEFVENQRLIQPHNARCDEISSPAVGLSRLSMS